MRFSLFLFLSLPLLFLALIGCAKKPPHKVVLTGVVVENGKPYQPGGDAKIKVGVLPAEKGGAIILPAAYGYCDKDSKFTVAPEFPWTPGRYAISVTVSGNGSRDSLNKEFSETESPLIYHITQDEIQDVVLDLGTKTVTVKKD